MDTTNSIDGLQTLLTLFFTVLMPFIVTWIKSNNMSKGQKYGIAFGVAVVLGLITCFASGQFNINDVAGTAGIIGMLATGIYNLWFKDKPFDEQSANAGALKLVTSPNRAKTYTIDPTDDA